ncbi:MAG: GMC family oxidoreductase [Flavobacteriaceae bacterium]|nr:GMC family oxidoreductase [Flavobacteriaceae bacterium]
MSKTISEPYDYIIVGSGFGGSVAAMRLSEKGYNVLVIEKGKHFRSKDFPKTNWNLKKYLWMPLIKCFGFQKLSFFNKVFILSGVGVGGGSLVYANTHMHPPESFFKNDAWSRFKDWKMVLAPFYKTANFMLGSTPAKATNIEDELLREVAMDMGRENSYAKVDVGVYYGDTKTAVDPYFNGHGPLRNGCTECAGCMVGCRENAKNTLDKNYLYFAQSNGARIHAETLVEKIIFDKEMGEYTVETHCSTKYFKRNKQQFKTKGIILSGGVLGTLDLLLKQKYTYKTLPKLSDTLGENLRTNSESLIGVISKEVKLNNGVAISSVFNPDDDTHIELVKFPNGSSSMVKMATIAVDEQNPLLRLLKFPIEIIKHPRRFLRMLFGSKLAENSVILLVMQSLDNALKMTWKKGLFGAHLSIQATHGKLTVPAYIPIGQKVMHKYAEKVKGFGANAITEIGFNMSSTAHIIGGCPMGENATNGTVDTLFNVFNYPNMKIMDASIIPCNLGVNPSLTITALSEYAMSQVPEKEGNIKVKLEDKIARKAVL